MKITDKTVINVSIGLLIATFLTVARISWTVSEINTKVEALWSAHMPIIVANTSTKGTP